MIHYFVIGVVCFVFFMILCYSIIHAQEQAEINHAEEMREYIHYTRLINVNGGDVTSYTTTNGGIGRAAVGWAIAGPVGGIIGASTAGHRTYTKNGKQMYMFMVYYKDGTRERDTVEEGTPFFEVYMDKLDLGDIQKERTRQLQAPAKPKKRKKTKKPAKPAALEEDSEFSGLNEEAAIKLPSSVHEPDMLSELKRAYRMGIITKEEYIEKKSKLQ